MPLITPLMLQELPLVDIPDKPPVGFSPVQVIHRELTRNPGGAPLYKDIDRPTPVPAMGFSIQQFAREIALNGRVRNPPPPQEQQENLWTSIRLSRDSYVVIELTSMMTWKYTTMERPDGTDQEGICLNGLSDDDPDPLSHYGDLHYVDGSGVDFDHPVADCRVAYFSARPMKNDAGEVRSYQQPLFIVVDQPGGSHEYIDPDIRFPGNGSG